MQYNRFGSRKILPRRVAVRLLSLRNAFIRLH